MIFRLDKISSAEGRVALHIFMPINPQDMRRLEENNSNQVMKIASKFSILLFILSIAVIGCEDAGNNDVTAEVSKDSVTVQQATNVGAPGPVLLKELTIDSKTATPNSQFFKSKVLDETDRNRLSLKLIDSTASGDEALFKYHLVDTLFSNSIITIVLIGREYVEENILWVASYDANARLVDRLMVYYDNSEGSMQIGSIVKRDQVQVIRSNDYGETETEGKKVELYEFDKNNRLIKKN